VQSSPCSLPAPSSQSLFKQRAITEHPCTRQCHSRISMKIASPSYSRARQAVTGVPGARVASDSRPSPSLIFVKTVSFSGDVDPIIDFASFALRHNVCHCIRYFTFDLPPHWDRTRVHTHRPKSYAFLLGDVFQQATNLESLSVLHRTEDLFDCEPRLAAAIVAHPPHELKLHDVGVNTLRSLREIYNLHSLYLSNEGARILPENAADVTELLLNSASTLKTLSLEKVAPSILDPACGPSMLGCHTSSRLNVIDSALPLTS